jgi:hypothetical protein
MSKSNHIQNLSKIVKQLKDAEKHLKISYSRCQKIGLEGSSNEDHLIEFEALTGRFARLVDMLIHKFFRAIDTVELVDTGTLIDVINRAEKRGLIDSALEARTLKDLRNDIAHEYLTEKLTLLQTEVYQSVPKLLSMISNAIAYAQKYLTTP